MQLWGYSLVQQDLANKDKQKNLIRVLQTQLLQIFYPQDILEVQVEEVLNIVFIDHLWHLILQDTLREQ